MRFKYRDAKGKVVALPDVASLLRAIREGTITPETDLAVGDERTFQAAGLVAAYQQAATAASRTGSTATIQSIVVPVEAEPWHARKHVRIGLVIGAAVLTITLAAARVHSNNVADARRLGAPPPGPPPATRQAVASFTAEFGDSAAVAQHRLQEWLRHQRIADHFRGAGLKAPSALRAVRVAAARYRSEVDSMLARSRDLAVNLVARADSAEGIESALLGVAGLVEDALVEWQRDLTLYAEIQRAAAATIDSIAAFMLDRQQSFAVREGQAVFLSRADAAHFREMAASLDQLAGREKAWADALEGRRPGWLASLAEAERPRFGRSVLNDPASSSP